MGTSVSALYCDKTLLEYRLGYGLVLGLGYGLGYWLGLGLGYGLGCGLGYELGAVAINTSGISTTYIYMIF